MWQTYHAPASLPEALALLDRYGPEARLIAGGTDLIIEIERGLRSPRALIDISRIDGLDEIRLDGAGRIHLGPLVTHNRVVGSELCRTRAFPLALACWQVGAPQIRNRATVAGNLVTASPANDTITPLWALGAQVTLRSQQRGQRSLSFPEFFLGVRRTALADDEMITDISFPALAANQTGTFEKLGLRRAQAIAVVNVAVVLSLEGNRVRRARITLGSVAPTIVRAPAAEEALRDQPLSEAVIERAARLAVEAAAPIDDVRGSAAYRRYAVEVYTRRALRALQAGQERQALPARPVMLWGRTDGRFPPARQSPPPYQAAGDEPIVTTVNGQRQEVRGAGHKTLLRMLRENLNLTGTKEGCAEGECGACTVLLDGVAVVSCLLPAARAHGSEILTIEGLGADGELHPLQSAFIDEGAVQCGYCTPGFLLSGASLLAERPRPNEDEIKQALTGNLCRCTGYYQILQALSRAAKVGGDG
ncbi:MAG: FAD binding domain-containing protein [Anaerolineae bacterium]